LGFFVVVVVVFKVKGNSSASKIKLWSFLLLLDFEQLNYLEHCKFLAFILILTKIWVPFLIFSASVSFSFLHPFLKDVPVWQVVSAGYHGWRHNLHPTESVLKNLVSSV
jgi:hypothetical protein